MKNDLGINIFGFIDGEFGLGTAVRLLLESIKNANIKHTIYNFDRSLGKFSKDLNAYNNENKVHYYINLILVGNEDIDAVLWQLEKDNFLENTYSIFYLNWESESFPLRYAFNISFFDEVWVATNYCREIISKYVDVPVQVIQYPILEHKDNATSIDTENFYDKSKFNFLFLFDYNSSFERKNPIGLINAFKTAFEADDKKVMLTIKTSKTNSYKFERELLFNSIEGYNNIRIVENTFSNSDLNFIIENCDSYISLHRSEGFGLTMAEAMSYKKPVIATAYSGNLEFMNEQNSFLVDFDKKVLENNTVHYEKGTIWSEPNINNAAELIKKVFSNTIEVQNIALNGYQDIHDKFSVNKIGKLIENRMLKIYSIDKKSNIKNNLIYLKNNNSAMSLKLRILNKNVIVKLIYKIKMFIRDKKKKNKF